MRWIAPSALECAECAGMRRLRRIAPIAPNCADCAVCAELRRLCAVCAELRRLRWNCAGTLPTAWHTAIYPWLAQPGCDLLTRSLQFPGSACRARFLWLTTPPVPAVLRFFFNCQSCRETNNAGQKLNVLLLPSIQFLFLARDASIDVLLVLCAHPEFCAHFGTVLGSLYIHNNHMRIDLIDAILFFLRLGSWPKLVANNRLRLWTDGAPLKSSLLWILNSEDKALD